MKNEKLKNKRVEEVATYLTHYMKLSKEEIAKAIYKYEMVIEAIEDIDMRYLKSGLVYVCGDVIIFSHNNGAMTGIDVKSGRYLSDDDCVDLLDPEFYFVGDIVKWSSRKSNLINIGEV